MPRHQRISRDEAARHAERVLRRVAEGQGMNRLITAVWIFGSFRAGAQEVGDVDLIATYDAEDAEWQQIRSAAIEKWINGGMRPDRTGDPERKLERAMVGNAGRFVVVELVRSEDDLRPPEVFQDRLLLYRRGDNVETALEKLRAIPEVKGAGRTPVKNVPNNLRWLDGLISRPALEELSAAVRNQQIAIWDVSFGADVPGSARSRRAIEGRWGSRSSASKRAAARAAAAWLERQPRTFAAEDPFGGTALPGDGIADLSYEVQWSALEDRFYTAVVKVGGSWAPSDAVRYLSSGCEKNPRELWLAILNPEHGPPWRAVVIRPGTAMHKPKATKTSSG